MNRLNKLNSMVKNSADVVLTLIGVAAIAVFDLKPW